MDEILDYLDDTCGEDGYNTLPDGTIIVADWAFVPELSWIARINGRYVTRDSEGNYVIAGRNFTTDYPVGVGAVGDDAGWAAATATKLASILGARKLQKTQHGRQSDEFLSYSFGPGPGRVPVPTSAKLIAVLKAFPDALITAEADNGLRISLPFPDLDTAGALWFGRKDRARAIRRLEGRLSGEKPATFDGAELSDRKRARLERRLARHQAAAVEGLGHGDFDTESEAYGITDVFDRWSGPIALTRAGEFAGRLYPRVDAFGYGG